MIGKIRIISNWENITGNVIYHPTQQGGDSVKAALKLCKGSYQEGLIRGDQNWSGSDLQGKAKDYASKYAQSRTNLLRRLDCNNIPHHFYFNKHNKRILVLGVW